MGYRVRWVGGTDLAETLLQVMLRPGVPDLVSQETWTALRYFHTNAPSNP